CYGTAGLARVQQLAALALGDARRQIAAEHALTAALTDPAQLGATTDLGLCHGVAGLVHIAARAATDAGPVMTEHLRAVIPPLLTAVLPHGDTPEDHAATLIHAPDGGPGLLDGAAGIALALTTADDHEPSRTGWDSCLLIA
nr:lanthionine synthetase [Pseudonocardiales bacterium]